MFSQEGLIIVKYYVKKRILGWINQQSSIDYDYYLTSGSKNIIKISSDRPWLDILQAKFLA